MGVEANQAIRNLSLNLLYCRFYRCCYQVATIVICLPFHIIFFSCIIVLLNETKLVFHGWWDSHLNLFPHKERKGDLYFIINWNIKNKYLGHFFSRNSKEMICIIIVMWIYKKKNQAYTNESHSELKSFGVVQRFE